MLKDTQETLPVGDDQKVDERKRDTAREIFETGYSVWNQDGVLREPEKITKESRAKQTGFSNFQQRDYDFDALEQQLLRSQKGD